MNNTLITYPSGNTSVMLTPSEGYKHITNGTVFSDCVYLGKNANANDWQDTNDEPPEPDEDIGDTEALSIIEGAAV